MRSFAGVLLCFAMSLSMVLAQSPSPAKDVKVDVGGFDLQFHVTPGIAPTIVFEAGGGDDSSTWRDTVNAVVAKTGARIVTYDRAGFGQSEPDPRPYNITAEVESLERGLQELRIDANLLVVAHSYGGFPAVLFAARNPRLVKGLVLIDANLAPFFTDAVVGALTSQVPEELEPIKRQDPRKAAALERVMTSLPATARILRTAALPDNLPITDIVAERPPVPPPLAATWIRIHQDFGHASPNRRSVFAEGSGHFVMRDRPDLVVDEIVAMFQRAK